jgi:hypothetical protein
MACGPIVCVWVWYGGGGEQEQGSKRTTHPALCGVARMWLVRCEERGGGGGVSYAYRWGLPHPGVTGSTPGACLTLQGVCCPARGWPLTARCSAARGTGVPHSHATRRMSDHTGQTMMYSGQYTTRSTRRQKYSSVASTHGSVKALHTSATIACARCVVADGENNTKPKPRKETHRASGKSVPGGGLMCILSASAAVR